MVRPCPSSLLFPLLVTTLCCSTPAIYELRLDAKHYHSKVKSHSSKSLILDSMEKQHLCQVLLPSNRGGRRAINTGRQRTTELSGNVVTQHKNKCLGYRTVFTEVSMELFYSRE